MSYPRSARIRTTTGIQLPRMVNGPFSRCPPWGPPLIEAVSAFVFTPRAADDEKRARLETQRVDLKLKLAEIADDLEIDLDLAKRRTAVLRERLEETKDALEA